MDVFEYRAARTVNTEGVFTVAGNDTEIGGLFMRLKNAMVSELHLQWDVAFLEQYISEHMVPRSLRWDIHPQQGDPDLDSWYKYFNDAGTEFLGFLNSKKKNRLQVLDREIKELKDKLLQFKNSQEYHSLSSNLQSFLEKEDREQKNKKHKKYSRDAGDYKSGLVFGWQKTLLANTNPEVSSKAVVHGPHAVNNMVNTSHSSHTQPKPPPTPRGYLHEPVGHLGPQRGRHPSYHTPPPPHRGRANNRNKRGGRGRSRGNQHYHQTPHYVDYRNYGYNGSPVRTYDNPPPYDSRYYDHPSIPVYNRFSPLRHREDQSYNRNEYNRSSLSQNRYDLSPKGNQDFRQGTQGRKRSSDPKEVLEGGGESREEKRKRT